MKLTVVRYRTKPEMAEENARLIEAVFQELRAKRTGLSLHARLHDVSRCARFSSRNARVYKAPASRRVSREEPPRRYGGR